MTNDERAKRHFGEELDQLKHRLLTMGGLAEERVRLALHQPMAGDLRSIVAAVKINSDLERVGDHATNIAEDVIFIVAARDVRHHASDSS